MRLREKDSLKPSLSVDHIGHDNVMAIILMI